MKLVGTLEAHYSKPDKAGNCYWGFRFIDHETGKIVEGLIGIAGESNINAVRLYWDGTRNWTNSLRFVTVPHGIREFDNLTKDWAHVSCDPEEMTKWIKRALST